MSKTYIEVDRIHGGQVRAYGPSVYEYRITLTRDNYKDKGLCEKHGVPYDPIIPADRKRDEIIAFLKAFFFADFRHDYDGKGPVEWHEYRLKEITEESPGVWHVRIEQPYLD